MRSVTVYYPKERSEEAARIIELLSHPDLFVESRCGGGISFLSRVPGVSTGATERFPGWDARTIEIDDSPQPTGSLVNQTIEFIELLSRSKDPARLTIG